MSLNNNELTPSFGYYYWNENAVKQCNFTMLKLEVKQIFMEITTIIEIIVSYS